MKNLRIVAATTAVITVVAGAAGYGVALAQGGQERAQGGSAQSPVTQAEMRRHHDQVSGGMRHMHDQMMGSAGVRRHHRDMMGDRDMRRLHDEMMSGRTGRRSPTG